jgi:ribosomal protein S13
VRQLEKFMRDITRLIASGFIWMMLAIILTSNTAASSNAVALAFILGIGATISTAAIWQSGNKSQESADEVEKHKRRTRVSRLMDEVDHKLDDEEVYELEELLAARRDDAIRRRSQ